MKLILAVRAETAMVRFVAICWNMKEFLFRYCTLKCELMLEITFLDVFIFFTFPAAFSLLSSSSRFCSVSSFFSLAPYLHGIHQQGERGSLA